MKVMNLRDLQDVIEREEFETHPINDWSRPFYFCHEDGALYENPEDHCPNPYHPNLPPRAPNRGFLYLIVASVCIALIYSIINNEALVTLIVTFLLVIISAVVFIILLVAIIYIRIKVAPSPAEREKDRKLAGLLSSLISDFFAMIVVSLMLGQFPSLTWWIIEFAIEYALDSFITDRLALWIYGRELPPDEAPPIYKEAPEVIQDIIREIAVEVWHHLLLFVASLAVGFWFLCPVFFDGSFPWWAVPSVFGPLVGWSLPFFHRFFTVWDDSRFDLLRQDWFLSLVCAYIVLKPTKKELIKYPWLSLLFHVFLAIPGGCFVTALVLLF